MALLSRLCYLSRLAEKLDTAITLGMASNEPSALHKLNLLKGQIDTCQNAYEKLKSGENAQ